MQSLLPLCAIVISSPAVVPGCKTTRVEDRARLGVRGSDVYRAPLISMGRLPERTSWSVRRTAVHRGLPWTRAGQRRSYAMAGASWLPWCLLVQVSGHLVFRRTGDDAEFIQCLSRDAFVFGGEPDE